MTKEDLATNLWMDNGCLRNLSDNGHIIGLHSYSHPTRMCNLPDAVQAEEYQLNFDHIRLATGKQPVTMSHPCNSYNAATLAFLRSLDIQMGFCANMSDVTSRSHLEFARKDHTDVMKEMRA